MHEQSRRPRASPRQTDKKVEALIIRARQRRPGYGPKKLIELLTKEYPHLVFPAVSTLAKILLRRGLSAKRARRRSGQVVRLSFSQLTQAKRPNEVWAVDFKGWFKTKDGRRCDPLAITDLYSRYIVCVRAVCATTQRVIQGVFKRVFRHYGLPDAIRVDNGPPFASVGLGGLSKLSVWWTSLGIRVEFIRPASPYMNGSHERMHRTLKAATTLPPSRSLRAQQHRFDRWRKRFNHERPHEAIGMRRPADLYQPSAKRYNHSAKTVIYPESYLVKKISDSGFLYYSGTNYHLGEAFAGVFVGLCRNSSNEMEVFFANKSLGFIYSDTGPIPAYGLHRLCI